MHITDRTQLIHRIAALFNPALVKQRLEVLPARSASWSRRSGCS
jgi:hypothetical protein